MGHKKLLIILLAVVLLGTLLVSVFAGFFPKQKLSEMSDKRLMAFIKNSGISIPEPLEGNVELIRWIITELENDPEHHTPVLGWTIVSDLYDEIRVIVKSYYAE